MKKSLITYTAAALGIWATLSMAPSFAQAEGDGSGLLELNVEVLSDNEVLHIEATDLPLLGDANVEIPAEEKNEESGESISEAAAVVSLEDSIAEDVTVEVLTATETNTAEESAVVDVS
uniref:hypothetical protein n=1 Tax=Planococcus sp. CAU13 TaxID=1541197 RepID=UPI00052FE591